MGYKYDICPHCGTRLPEEGYICPACGSRNIFEESPVLTFAQQKQAEIHRAREKAIKERGETQVLKEEAEQRTYDAILEWICNIGPVVIILGTLYYFGLLGMIWDLVWMIISMPFRNG